MAAAQVGIVAAQVRLTAALETARAADSVVCTVDAPEPTPEPEPTPDPTPDPEPAPVLSGVTATVDTATRQTTLSWATPRTGTVTLTRADSTGRTGTTTRDAAEGTYLFSVYDSGATWVDLTISAQGETQTERLDTTAATPLSDPTPAPTGPKLTWAPPAGHESYPVRNAAVTTQQQTISGSGDVRVVLPDSVIGPIILSGFRNVVVVGGSIRALPVSQIGGTDQRLIYVRDVTGTVHLEGQLLDGNGSAGAETDAITANGSNTIVQVQNVRVVGLEGTQGTNHADVIQTWSGLQELRVDRLTGYSNYQGIKFQLTNTFRISKVDLRRVNLRGLTDQKYLFWMDPADIVPVVFNDVWILPVTGRDFGQSVWPGVTNATNPARVANGQATWPTMSKVSGHISNGLPPGGDFVPTGAAGLGYVSPGYL